MKVLILTQAGKNIGFGHLTRCIGLYQGFREKRIPAEIIVDADNSVDFLLKGIKHRKMSWLKNRKIIFEELKNVNIAVIDSYLSDLYFYKMVSKIVEVPVYIDDYKRLNYPSGIVINPSIYGDKLKYSKKEGMKYLLGKNYIILRKEFWNVPKKKINKRIKNILITSGGAINEKIILKLLKFLSVTFPDFTYHVFTNSNLNLNFNLSLKLYRDLSVLQIRNLMLKADVCISGGGQTTYELARVGLPTIGICFAKNQKFNLKGWQEKEFIEYAGWYYDKDLISNISESIGIMSISGERLKRSEIGRTLVDSKGIDRIIKGILN